MIVQIRVFQFLAKKLKGLQSFILTLATLALLSSCLDQAPRDQRPLPNDLSSNSTNTPEDTTPLTPLARTGIGEVNFFQEGTLKTTTQLTLFADFKDSFTLRGDGVSTHLIDTITYPDPNNPANFLTRPTPIYCLAMGYDQTTASGKELLLMAARVRFFNNTELRAREYFFQIDPNNDSINAADCSSVNLMNSLNADFGTTNITFKLSQVCPDCELNKVSKSAVLYNNLGQRINNIELGPLGIRLLPSLGSSGASETFQSCTTDGFCKQSNFNCCLNGQCVNHGQNKPNVSTSSPEYLSALQVILTEPQKIKDYRNFFYVCNEFIPDEPDNSGDDPNLDPIAQANDLFSELEDLYNCLNPVIDEFSICTFEADIDINRIGSGGNNYVVPIDDLTFKSINPALGALNNITNILYAGEYLYKDRLFSTDPITPTDPSVTFIGSSNDDITAGRSVSIDKAISPDAPNTKVKIRYRVDGTCERIGPSLARCTKTYIQGQSSSPARASDHPAGQQIFKVPNYANFAFNVLVEVGGLRIAPGNDTWRAQSLGTSGAGTSNKQIQFTDMIIPTGQEVKISYYVSQNVDNLMTSKDLAFKRLDEHCHCDDDLGCNLTPIITESNNVSTVTSYECVYPAPVGPTPLLQETVYVSAKSVPHRYYDENGVHRDFSDTGVGAEQEGEKFEYLGGNLLRPNNVSTTIGFNEIYGSMSRTPESAMPAYVLTIEKGKVYDIFVDEGAFSSCLNCGTDPYSSLAKLFPSNFTHGGGGYIPNPVESRRRDGRSVYPSDEMRFGRACFVPATMIPWTHSTQGNIETQRRTRLKAQHFLFANGYNRDWYGFDYGSLIGSYDGVRWFSIGNQRRIQSKGNKLFLAINAYFGDLTINNTFKVTVSETTAVLNSGSAILHDTESDGAECQKHHFCQTDNDCITQLGYDYTCQNITSLKTPWPLFDANGNEILGENTIFLTSLVGGTSGEAKRCVYRGSGSLCAKDLNQVTSTNSYAKSSTTAFHACSPNNYCASMETPRFNTKIARYGETPASQNNRTYITNDFNQGRTDTVGLGARSIGRPFTFFGDETRPSDLKRALDSINVTAMCVPGKNPIESTLINDLGSDVSERLADKMFGIGPTAKTSDLMAENYYAACPATDDEGNYLYNQRNQINKSTSDLNDDSGESLAVQSAAQNLSTNLLDLAIFDNLALFNDTSAQKTRMGYQKNACLRSPGSKCYSDLDCAPNRFITTKTKTLTQFGDLNAAEAQFWKQELTCGQSAKRYLQGALNPDPLYDITEHKCCMPSENEFIYKTQPHENSDFDVVLGDGDRRAAIAGINIPINSSRRYSSNNVIYDKLVSENSKYFPLYHAAKRPEVPFQINTISELTQYNTLHLHNSRMCCSGHWVRKFASGVNANGGGHKFSAAKAQNLPPITFRPLSWFAQDSLEETQDVSSGSSLPYTCSIDDYVTTACEIRTIVEDSNIEKRMLDYFARFELIGIPQVIIPTTDSVYRELGDRENIPTYFLNDLFNHVTFDEQTQIPDTVKLPFLNTVKSHLHDIDADGEIDAIVDVNYNGKTYFSAASYDNFQMGFNQLKKVFSEDEFNCCLPTGFEINDLSVPESACCTGKMAQASENSNKCCLDDFTDLSVYTNRYVSSEGASFNGQEISESDIDRETGYLRTEKVLQMAATMCCSGAATTGVVLNEYFTPIDYTEISDDKRTTRRWLYDETLDNANEVGGGYTKYNQGLKFNHHVYCVNPETIGGDDNSGGNGGSGPGAVQN